VRPASRIDLVSALLVGAEPQDRLVILDICREAGWRLHEARDRKGALACLERQPVQVVVANADLPKWPWKAALQDLQRMTRPPQLVVTSRLADDSLWVEVLSSGGYDLLAEPLDRAEVERVLTSARRHFDPPLTRRIPPIHTAAAS
jgi:DNA-binding response OmpR family regulator